jgi:cell division protein FtsB
VKLATIVLLAMLAVLQYTLWLGKGGWLRIWSLERDIEAQSVKQARLRESNGIGRADVEDLRTGLDAVDELARREIGMLRKDESLFQYPQPSGPSAAASAETVPGGAAIEAPTQAPESKGGVTEGRGRP